MASTDLRTRCVLLTPPEESDAASQQLQQRGWIAHPSTRTLSALAELCLLERAIESRRSWGLAPVEELALVIVESSHWSDLPELLAATRRYVPSAATWAIRDGRLTPLAPARPPETRTRAAVNDRPAPTYDKGYDKEPPPPSVTGDEIGMLLDDGGPE